MEPEDVAARLMASWRRSEDYGVDHESVRPVFAGTPPQEGDSLFLSCGNDVLAGLHRTLASEPLSLMLTDADGLVLNRFSGDTGLLRALDKVHLAPGFTYAEREVGTNGLGLALADRVPTVVRADEHYSASLRTYTCAAAPVLDPLTGRLEGAVNITTWSRSSSDLLLALAQSAAGNTSALMLARSHGRGPEPARGRGGKVSTTRLEPGTGTLAVLSPLWTEAVDAATAALGEGRVVLAVGESGAGRATLLAQALRRTRRRDRILGAAAPAPHDVPTWLDVWVPELVAEHTSVVISGVDGLPAWAAEEVAERLRLVRAAARGDRSDHGSGEGLLWTFTAGRYADVPAPLAALVDTVVEVPPLRDRPGDVMGLARHAAYQVRGREVAFTRAAEHALESYAWPGNVAELVDVVRTAAARTDRVGVAHLPGDVLSGSPHRLTRLEAHERDEIVRCLSRPGATARQAAEELGISRATIYRKIAAYGIHVPR